MVFLRRTVAATSLVFLLANLGTASAQQPPLPYPQPPPQPQPGGAPPPATPTPAPAPAPTPGYSPPPTPGYPAQPQQPAPYPQQPYPQPQPQPAPYPAQPQPAPYPQQPGYAPAPQYPPPPGYGQPPPAGYGQPPPGYPMAPPSPPVPSNQRDPNELAILYGTGIAYGLGTGIWIDALAKVSDPGIAFIAPLALGAAAPIGVYYWDQYDTFRRGVPASISTGLALGAVEGIAISGTQWQHSGNGGPDAWSFGTQTTITFALATGGGVGGYFFGEYYHPDPRSLAFIADGAAWGAISGSLFGAGVGTGDWKDGASTVGLAGYNLGILTMGAISIAGYVPSWKTQQSMWLGYVAGTAAASVVYLFYIGSDSDPRHGLIANSLGGLAGVGVAWALTGNMKDDGSTASGWKPPFYLGMAPAPGGGGVMTAMGQF